jgi:hypothetical protein
MLSFGRSGTNSVHSVDGAFSGRAKRFTIINLNAVRMVLLHRMIPQMAQGGHKHLGQYVRSWQKLT